MKRFFKLSRLLASLTLFASLGAVAVGLSSSPLMASAESASEGAASSVSLPENEQLLSSDELHISITTSSTTPKSHSIGAKFSSLISTFKNRTQEGNLYFTIDDSSYDPEADLAPEYADDGTTLIGPIYTSSLYALYGTNASWADVVIPSTITRAKGFILNITSIMSGSGSTNVPETNRADAYKNVTSIIIPKHIETIGENAFENVPDDVTIKCEATEQPAGWAEGWTDAKNVEWGYSLSDAEKARLNQRGGTPFSFSANKAYIIGSHYEVSDYYKPLIASYSVLDSNGSIVRENNLIEVPLTSTSTLYDEVGGSVTSVSVTFDIEKEEGQTIDVSSIVFHNIYVSGRAEIDGTSRIAPDLSQAYYGVPTIAYSDEIDITDIINYKISMVSTYVGYLDFNLSVDLVPNVYPNLMPSMYKENQTNIESGAYAIRYLFSSLNQASYRIAYKSGDEIVQKTLKVSTPIEFLILSQSTGNYAGFSLKMSDIADDFSFDSVVSVELIGLRVKLDIYNNDTSKSVNKSDFSRRFGVIDLYRADIGASYTSIETMVLTWTGIYIAVFVAGAAAYYFYAKNRYKNDEFRRMNTKKYLIAAGKNLVGFGIIVLAILYNVARWCIMNTSVVSYNPTDAYLIVFTVAGAIFLGFFIKGVVQATKDTIKRKKDARLNLDKDVAEDGTN